MDKKVFAQRREQLAVLVKNANANKDGVILLFAGLQDSRYKFRQASCFYYYTGINEPGLVAVINLNDNKLTIFRPNYISTGATWSTFNTESMATDIKALGEQVPGHCINALAKVSVYKDLVDLINAQISSNKFIFAMPGFDLRFEKLTYWVKALEANTIDISNTVASMRCVKDKEEIQAIFNAVDCTMAAHEAASSVIEEGKHEYQVAAGVEFVFVESGASAAFPIIVASGSNSTILHYDDNNKSMKKGELVIVDIGAQINHYCADITRTYPVSGTFSKRQREVYDIVLKAQEYIASKAVPGMWLFNPEKPEKCLHHLAMEFFKKAGYEQYFTHRIGHYLGLDVHDVGNYKEPLAIGNVITIEPGLYISKENIGIRIEDVYWIVDGPAICLSEDLPRQADMLEDMMAQSFEGPDLEEDEDYDEDEEECDDEDCEECDEEDCCS